jgi:hypothetical protein
MLECGLGVASLLLSSGLRVLVAVLLVKISVTLQASAYSEG